MQSAGLWQRHHGSGLHVSWETHLPQIPHTEKWGILVKDEKRPVGHVNAYNLGGDYCSYTRVYLEKDG